MNFYIPIVLFYHDSTGFTLLPSPGNPLAQEIMSLYQEHDGTRRLLNYLLDNLAGAIKRSESPSLAVLTVVQEFNLASSLNFF